MKWPDPVRINIKTEPRRKAKKPVYRPVYYDLPPQQAATPASTYVPQSTESSVGPLMVIGDMISLLFAAGSSNWLKKLGSGLLAIGVFIAMVRSPFLMQEKHPTIFYMTVTVVVAGTLLGLILLYHFRNKGLAERYGERIGFGDSLGLTFLAAGAGLMALLWASAIELIVFTLCDSIKCGACPSDLSLGGRTVTACSGPSLPPARLPAWQMPRAQASRPRGLCRDRSPPAPADH